MTCFAATQDLTNPGSGSVPVTLEVTSSYTVTLPSTINLDYAETGVVYTDSAVYAGDYDIAIAGTVPSGKKLKVTASDVTLTTGIGGAGNQILVDNFVKKSEASSVTAAATSTSATTAATTVTETMSAYLEGKVPTSMATGSYTGTANITFALVD